MNLGAMRYLVHFYAPKQLSNKLGDVKTCYFYAFSAWASINELSSAESIESAKESAEITTSFKIRFAKLNTSFIALHNGNKEPIKKLKIALLSPNDKLYELKSIVDKTGLNKELEITAKIKERRELNARK